jgi:hypothetical protein
LFCESALRFHFYRLAVTRRAVKELAALAERRAALAHPRCSFRPLGKVETQRLWATNSWQGSPNHWPDRGLENGTQDSGIGLGAGVISFCC